MGAMVICNPSYLGWLDEVGWPVCELSMTLLGLDFVNKSLHIVDALSVDGEWWIWLWDGHMFILLWACPINYHIIALGYEGYKSHGWHGGPSWWIIRNELRSNKCSSIITCCMGYKYYGFGGVTLFHHGFQGRSTSISPPREN